MRLKVALMSSTTFIVSCTSPMPEGMYEVNRNDPEMKAAVRKAHATLPQFLATVQNHDSTAYNFAVKVPFDVGEQREFIWLSAPSIKAGKWYGTVDNTPEYTKLVKRGETVEWDTSNVADWNYTRNDTLIGEFSIRVLRSRMKDKDRINFDKSAHWIIK